MNRTRERFVVDPEGKKVEVVLPIEDYEILLEDLEELEAIRAFDAAKEFDDEAIPAEQAFKEIDQGIV